MKKQLQFKQSSAAGQSDSRASTRRSAREQKQAPSRRFCLFFFQAARSFPLSAEQLQDLGVRHAPPLIQVRPVGCAWFGSAVGLCRFATSCVVFYGPVKLRLRYGVVFGWISDRRAVETESGADSVHFFLLHWVENAASEMSTRRRQRIGW